MTTQPVIARISGVYNGVVVNNSDPLARARIQVTIANLNQFAAAPTEWALPAIPPGGTLPAVPVVGSTVYAIFSAGIPSQPMWYPVIE